MAKDMSDLVGQEIGSWEVISRESSRSGKSYWLCRCSECGEKKEIAGQYLRGTPPSCDCSRTTHGEAIKAGLVAHTKKRIISKIKKLMERYKIAPDELTKE